MILTKLKEYADTQMDMPPAMYKATPIRWFIRLSKAGDFETFIPLGGDKTNKRGETMLVPNLVRAASIKPKLLTDNGEYVLGIPDEKKAGDPAKVKERHQQFKEVVKQCADQTGEPTVTSVVTFLANWKPEEAQLPGGFAAADTLTFSVFDGEKYVIPAVELKAVQAFWASYTVGSEASEADLMQCLITGEVTAVEERMPEKIKGVPDGQTSGTSLVSANSQAFTSYALANSLTSPISRDAAESFSKALNHLLANQASRYYFGSLVYVFWTKKKTRFNFMELVSQPDAAEVRQLFQAGSSGKEIHGLESNRFYALALSASGARAVVRDWLETTIPEVERNVKRWFSGQRIVDAYGQAGYALGLRRLADSLYRDASKEMTPGVPAALARVALKGGALPDEILARAVRRNHVEKTVPYARAALIKLVLSTQGVAMPEQLEQNPKLDGNDMLAYQCGRLLAELEAIQQAALGRINATLVDRYYGAAASTPNSAFAPLLSNVRAHLGKLRKIKAGTWQAKERSLEEIISHFKSDADKPPKLPTTLTIQQQATFALGFYHQRAHNRAAAIAAKAAKEETTSTSQGVSQ